MFTEQTEHYKDHWTYGIIRHQSVLILIICLGASVIAAAGIRWQRRNRNGHRGTSGSPDITSGGSVRQNP
jgi:uncharacterized membrane protein YidH (DUF202 family)